MDSQYGRDLRRDLIQVSIKAKKSARVVQQLQGPRRGFCGNWGLLLLLLFFAPQDFVFCGVGFRVSFEGAFPLYFLLGRLVRIKVKIKKKLSLGAIGQQGY
jgi:hypothetical protein